MPSAIYQSPAHQIPSSSQRVPYFRPTVQSTALADVLAAGDAKISAMMTMSVRQFARGRAFEVSEENRGLVYRVRSGWLVQNYALPDGRHHCSQIFLSGDLVRLSSLFNNDRPQPITAASNGLVESIGSRELMRACLRDTDVSARCLWEMTQQEKTLHRWIVSLSHLTAEERVCVLLDEIRMRLIAVGAVAPASLEFAMPLTQVQLAASLGITAIHVNRVLKALRIRGVLEIQRGTVIIHDLLAMLRLGFSLSC